MIEGSNKQEITLGAGFEAVVHYGDTTIALHPGGDVELTTGGKAAVHTGGDVEVFTSAAVHLHPAVTDSQTAHSEPKPGDRMPDGTVFAGISPDTGKPMYTTPADAPLTMKWKDAMKYAAKLDAHGHKDWRAPTKAELNVLYENRDKGALKGTFNVTGSGPAGWYWSSTENYDDITWGQRFSDGNRYWGGKGNASSLRCVR